MTDKKGKRQYVITLISIITAIMIIVDFTFLSFYFLARSDAVALGESSLAEQSERLNNFLLKGLDVMEVTGSTVEHMIQEGRSLEEIQNYLIGQSEDYAVKVDKNFTGIYGYFKGQYLDGVGWVPEADYDPTTRPWYKAAMEGNGEPVVVSPYVDAQTGKVMISVSMLLEDKESVISLDMVMDEMQEFAESINLNGNGYGFILDDKGLIVAHYEAEEVGKNYLTDDNMQDTDMQKIAAKIIGGNGKTIEIRINGHDSRVFYKQVHEDLYVVMIVDVHDLFKKVEMNIVVNLILSTFIFGVVIFFIRSSHKNRTKAIAYAEELKEYQTTLEERVEAQTLEIQGQADKMLEIQENAVEGMASLIESRDGNTGEHVRSTKKYVSMILKYMYENKMHEDIITKKYVKYVKKAATLHDVGKIKISDVILNKPGKFTLEEYEIMKKHAPYGGEIVKDILGKNADEELLQIARNVARYHHEKWDGSGYPEGLKGEEIPLCARIMAVADVFDALVSKRVYKDAMMMDKAFQILARDAGRHFDPEIVEVFIKIREDVERYVEEKKK